MKAAADAVIHERRKLIVEARNPDIEYEKRVLLAEQAEKLRGYVCHVRGYSDITVERGGEYVEDYFAHAPVAPRTDTEGLPKRRARKVRKDDINSQLLMNYKYSDKMLRTKNKLYVTMCEALRILVTGFGMYGKRAFFAHEDGLWGYRSYMRLKQSVKLFEKEFEYIYTARRLRSLHGSYLPSNFSGRHKLMVLSDNSMDWLYMEGELEGLRANLTSDNEGNFDPNWCAQGVLTTCCMETILRIALRNGKFTTKVQARTVVYYTYTAYMKEYLPISEKDMHVENLKVRTLVSKMRASPSTELQIRAMTGELSEEEIKSFLNEMEEVQVYADMVYGM